MRYSVLFMIYFIYKDVVGEAYIISGFIACHLEGALFLISLLVIFIF